VVDEPLTQTCNDACATFCHDEGVGAYSLKHVPANRQAVHEDSDTSLLGGFDVKANLYLYLYTLWHAVVVIETRCELVSDCKPHVGMPTSASAIAERTPSSSPNGHANPLRAQHHGSLGGFKVKANLYIYIYIYIYTHVAHDRCN
jgi:hypothetical protein